MVELARVQALDQIEEKHYASLFEGHQNIDRVLKIGIAFCGKMMVCAHRENSINNLAELTEVSVCYGFDESKLRAPKPKRQVKRSASSEAFVVEEDEDDEEEISRPTTTQKRIKVAGTTAPQDTPADDAILLVEEDDIDNEKKRKHPQQKSPSSSLFKQAKKAQAPSNDSPGDKPPALK